MSRAFLAAFWFLGRVVGAPGDAKADPDSVPFVAVEVPADRWEELSADPDRTLRADLCLGARISLFQGGSRRVLSDGFESACEPDVSFDGKRILFAGRRSADDPWNIYELELESGEVRRITREVGNARQPRYLSKFYQIGPDDVPWFQILFVSDHAGELEKNSGLPAWDLYTCRLDGSDVRRITYNPATDWDPFLMQDGRLLFAAREQSLPEHGRRGRMRIFEVNVDGTDLTVLSRAPGRRIQQMPAVTGNGMVVFVEADEAAPDGGGTLGAVLLRRPHHTYRRLTDESRGWFLTPSPLPDGTLLVSHRDKPGRTYEVGRFDPETGEWTSWAASPREHLIFPRAVVPRPLPDGRSSSYRAERPNGQLYVLNLNLHDLPEREWLSPGVARRARIVEGIPVRSFQGRDSIPPGLLLPRRILGDAPVEEDGSIFVEIPANLPVQLQLLDENGLLLRSTGWIWVRNGIPQGCIGCHEDPELTPPNRLVEAVKKGPVKLTLPPQRRRTVDFVHQIAPIVEKRCAVAECHGSPAAGLFLGREGESDEAWRRRVYAALTRGVGEGEDPFTGEWISVGAARKSPLMWHVIGRDTRRPWDGAAQESLAPANGGRPLLEPLEIRLLAEWIDLGAQWNLAGLEPVPAHRAAQPSREEEGKGR
ncbi:MAG: hypothetical protein Kow00109_24320 [Acidobacteriota bacterium]